MSIFGRQLFGQEGFFSRKSGGGEPRSRLARGPVAGAKAANSRRKSLPLAADSVSWLGQMWSQRNVLGVVLLVIGVLLLPKAFWMEAESERSLVDPARIDLGGRPPWLEDGLYSRLSLGLASLPSVSLRDDRALEEWLDQVPDTSGWIERVESARKIFPDRLALQLKLREPVVLIETEAGLWLVDDQGILLGPANEALELIRSSRLPLLHHPRPLEMVRSGEQLAGPEYEEGLRVACEIAPYKNSLRPRGLEVQVVDISPLVDGASNRSSDVDLWTAGAIKVEWGRSRGSSPFGQLEADPEVKIQRIIRGGELEEKLSMGPDPRNTSLQAQFPDGAEDRLVEPISFLTSRSERPSPSSEPE